MSRTDITGEARLFFGDIGVDLQAAVLARYRLEQEVGRAMRTPPLPLDTTRAQRALNVMTDRATDALLGGNRG